MASGEYRRLGFHCSDTISRDTLFLVVVGDRMSSPRMCLATYRYCGQSVWGNRDSSSRTVSKEEEEKRGKIEKETVMQVQWTRHFSWSHRSVPSCVCPALDFGSLSLFPVVKSRDSRGCWIYHLTMAIPSSGRIVAMISGHSQHCRTGEWPTMPVWKVSFCGQSKWIISSRINLIYWADLRPVTGEGWPIDLASGLLLFGYNSYRNL